MHTYTRLENDIRLLKFEWELQSTLVWLDGRVYTHSILRNHPRRILRVETFFSVLKIEIVFPFLDYCKRSPRLYCLCSNPIIAWLDIYNSTYKTVHVILRSYFTQKID